MMQVSVLYSGGKDSNYALQWALNDGLSVKNLVSFKPEREDSFMFHVPCIDLTRLQAEAIEIPYVSASVSGVKEREVGEMKNILRGLDVDGIVSGALASDYQKSRIDKLCNELGMNSFAPLWHKNQREVVEDIAAAGFNVLISGVYADGFDESWIGRKIDGECIRDLIELEKTHEINVAGEGGEYETLVVDGPVFKKRIEITKSRVEWDGVRGQLVVENATLAGKPRL